MGKFHKRQAMKKRHVIPACSGGTSGTEITEDSYNDSEAVDMELQQQDSVEDLSMSKSEIVGSRNDLDLDFITAETSEGDTENKDYKQKLAETVGELLNAKELLLKAEHNLSKTRNN